MKSTLTPRQKQLLDYLKAHRSNAPTYREIAADLGFSSAGNVSDMIRRIAARGHMEMPSGKARCYVFK